MNRNSKIALAIIFILIIVFGIVLTIFMINNQANQELYLKEKIRISAFGEELGEFSLEELLKMTEEKEFEAIYKPNNMLPISRTYTGIYLRDLLIALDIAIEDINNVQFVAMDGLQRIYSKDNIIEEDNVFIAYLVEGKPFNRGILPSAYNKPEEDGGPFVVIRAKDNVSQNRVKLLVEINVQ